MIETRRLTVVEDTNTVILRDTEDKISIAAEIFRRIDRPRAEVEVVMRIFEVEASAADKALRKLKLDSTTDKPLRLEAGWLKKFKEFSGAKLLATTRLSLVGDREASMESERAGMAAVAITLGAEVHPANREVTLHANLEVEELAERSDKVRDAVATSKVETSARVADGTTLLLSGLLTHDSGRGEPDPRIVVTLTPTVIRVPGYEAADLEPIFVGTESRIDFDPSSD